MISEDVKIFPIFKQTPEIWQQFSSVMNNNSLTSKENDDCISDFSTLYSIHGEKMISYGAYLYGHMVGFSNGWYTDMDFGFGSRGWVKPEYQGKWKIGTRLLDCAERSTGMVHPKRRSYPMTQISKKILTDKGYVIGSDNYAIKQLSFPDSGKLILPVFYASPVMMNACFDIVYSIFKKTDIAIEICKDLKKSVQCHNPVFVCYLDGKIVGFINGEIFYKTQSFELKQLYVHRKKQKKYGIGSGLLSEFCNFAEHSGACKILLSALRDFDAKEFYKKFGFVQKSGAYNFMERG